MDLGCYVLNATRQFGRWLDQAPSVVSAEATLKKPDVDSAMWVDLGYPGGVRGRLHQLAALADTLQTGAEFLIDVDDSVANAELIDEAYRRAGLSPRG